MVAKTQGKIGSSSWESSTAAGTYRRSLRTGDSLATLPPAAHPVAVGRLSDRDWQDVQACVKTALAPLEKPDA